MSVAIMVDALKLGLVSTACTSMGGYRHGDEYREGLTAFLEGEIELWLVEAEDLAFTSLSELNVSQKRALLDKVVGLLKKVRMATQAEFWTAKLTNHVLDVQLKLMSEESRKGSEAGVRRVEVGGMMRVAQARIAVVDAKLKQVMEVIQASIGPDDPSVQAGFGRT